MRRFIAFLFLLSLPAQAGISANIAPGSSAYRLIDQLEAFGCAYPTYRALGPQSYSEIRAAIDVGEGQPGEVTDDGRPARCAIPNWMRRERDILMRGAQMDVSATAVLVRNDSLQLQGLDAIITPSVPLREGRPIFDGPNVYFEGSAGAGGGGEDFGFAFGIQPGFLAAFDNYKSLNGRVYLQEAYVKAGYKWAELSFGKSAMRFGNAEHGSLLLSAAQKPFTNLKLAVRPHILGAPFSWLGPFTFETWVSDGDDGSKIPDARYWGIALGFRPLPWFDISLMELYQFGGATAPSLSFSDYLKMLVYLSDADLEKKRQRAFGANLNIWGPDHFFKLYLQLYFDSLTDLSSWFSTDISPLVGLWFPKLGKWDFRVEFIHTVPGAYTHPIFGQGLTYKQTPVGHPIGPDADGLYADIGLPPLGDWRPGLNFLYEARGRSLTGKLAPNSRIGGGAELTKRWLRTELSAFVRYTQITNDDYQLGVGNQNVAGYLALRYTFF